MSFPRHSDRYDLLGTVAYRELAAEKLAEARRSILIISAYVTIAGLSWIRDNGTLDRVPVTILTQWKPRDLLSGASDLEAYKLSLDLGWRFCLLPNLHAKLLLIDDNYMFVGSSNVTAFGLSLVPGGNRELGICVAANAGDVRSAWGLVEESHDVSPEIFSKLKEWLALCPPITKTGPDVEWPLSIERMLARPPNRLWVSDLPWTVPDNMRERGTIQESSELDAVAHDMRLFGVEEYPNLETAFRGSIAYRWLVNKLEKEPDHAAYFGRLGELLHSSLLDDPAPFRKDVKSLLSNLLAYAAQFAKKSIVLDRPQYSTRVSLITI